MVTLEQAERFFELSPGAADDEYNAYRYMVLTAMARPLAYEKIPAVVHRDGTCRIQIVQEGIHPLVYRYLKAMGRLVGAEVSVNTSLNVGGPIAQSPQQALDAMKRAKALTGLEMIGANGEAFVIRHNVRTEPNARALGRRCLRGHRFRPPGSTLRWTIRQSGRLFWRPKHVGSDMDRSTIFVKVNLKRFRENARREGHPLTVELAQLYLQAWGLSPCFGRLWRCNEVTIAYLKPDEIEQVVRA